MALCKNVASGDAYDDMHQVWSQYAEALRRYSLTSIVACCSSDLFTRFFENVRVYQNSGAWHNNKFKH